MRARVTDQGIEKVDESEKVIAFAEHSAESPAALTSVSRNPVDGLVEAASGMVRCAFCRRESRWVRRGFLRRRRVVPEAGAG